MYLEIKNLSSDELNKLEGMFEDRIRTFTNVYQETCRVEAECTLENVLSVEELDALNDDEFNSLLDELAENIHDDCDDIFQSLCELSDETVKVYINKVI